MSGQFAYPRSCLCACCPSSVSPTQPCTTNVIVPGWVNPVATCTGQHASDALICQKSCAAAGRGCGTPDKAIVACLPTPSIPQPMPCLSAEEEEVKRQLPEQQVEDESHQTKYSSATSADKPLVDEDTQSELSSSSGLDALTSAQVDPFPYMTTEYCQCTCCQWAVGRTDCSNTPFAVTGVVGYPITLYFPRNIDPCNAVCEYSHMLGQLTFACPYSQSVRAGNLI